MRKTFDAWQADRQTTAIPARKDEQQRRAQWQRMAEVAAEKLTGRPEWDSYLAVMQGGIDERQAAIAALTARLVHPAVVDHLEILQIKQGIATATGAIEALQWALDWPRQLVAERQATAAVKPAP